MNKAQKAGLKLGKKLGSGFVVNPDASLHAGSVKYIRNLGAVTLEEKLAAQREFKQAAYEGYRAAAGL